MNPFSRFLSQRSKDDSFVEFVTYWDELEMLVIGLYRQRLSLDAATADFDRVWRWLRQNYSRFECQLAQFWPETTAAGAPVRSDPFRMLLDLPGPEAIAGNWPAMQHLPAAREAINRYLAQQDPEWAAD